MDRRTTFLRHFAKGIVGFPSKSAPFCLLLLLHVSSVSIEAADPSSHPLPARQRIEISKENHPPGGTAIKAVFEIKAEPHIVYETLCDAALLPEFLPFTKSVDVLESGPGYQVIHFIGSATLWESNLIVERKFDDAGRRISWSRIKGRPKEARGFVRVEAQRNTPGSLVTYQNYVRVDGWIPNCFIRDSITQMITNIRKLINGGGV